MNIFTIFSCERVPKEKLIETDRGKVKQTIQKAFDKGNGSVDLSQIYIEKLPVEFEELRNLVWITPTQEITSQIQLYMSMNLLNYFPREILSLKNLTVLVFKHNYTKVLPPEIGTLSSLRELSVSHNLLEYLPRTLFDLKNLELFIGYPNPYMKMSGEMVLVKYDTHAPSLKELSLRVVKKNDSENCNILLKHKIQIDAMEGHRCPVCNICLCESASDLYLSLRFSPSGQFYPFQFRFCTSTCLNSPSWKEMLEQLLRPVT